MISPSGSFGRCLLAFMQSYKIAVVEWSWFEFKRVARPAIACFGAALLHHVDRLRAQRAAFPPDSSRSLSSFANTSQTGPRENCVHVTNARLVTRTKTQIPRWLRQNLLTPPSPYSSSRETIWGGSARAISPSLHGLLLIKVLVDGHHLDLVILPNAVPGLRVRLGPDDCKKHRQRAQWTRGGHQHTVRALCEPAKVDACASDCTADDHVAEDLKSGHCRSKGRGMRSHGNRLRTDVLSA